MICFNSFYKSYTIVLFNKAEITAIYQDMDIYFSCPQMLFDVVNIPLQTRYKCTGRMHALYNFIAGKTIFGGCWQEADCWLQDSSAPIGSLMATELITLKLPLRYTVGATIRDL
jgi:hypothetical protein